MTLPAALDAAAVALGAEARMARLLTAPFASGAEVLRLSLVPVVGASHSAEVSDYDFAGHLATSGRAPTPSYVVRTLRDLGHDTRVRVRVTDPALPGGRADAVVDFRAGRLAGESVPLVLPAGASGAARLARITVTRRSGTRFVAAPDSAAQGWAISALLGNTARLLWVLGGERDALRRHIARTARQRRLATAHGASLDLIGTDLAVPRFPPLPHAVDDHTVALYHLGDAAGSAPAAEDATGRFPGRTAHHAAASGAVVLGVPGRYGTAAAFSGTGALTVPSDPALDVPADRDLTAECFVRPDLTASPAPDARVLARCDAAGLGWSIEVGEFGRGPARSVRARVFDGGTELILHGDQPLPTDRFTHLALVLDRSAAACALWVGGVRADLRDTGPLGALAPAAPLTIGPGSGTSLWATVDEVRISRVARRDFSPVLGESDEHYRRRLRIFQRWTLPTRVSLAGVLNEAVGTIDGVENPIVVDDSDGPMTRGHLLVRVVPSALAPGESIDAAGHRDAEESELYGDADDLHIPPVLLLRHDRPRIDYAPAADGDPHLMQPPIARALDRLTDLVTFALPLRLRVSGAWLPGAGDARAAGRGVVLTHPAVAAPKLAALAHRAGFALVELVPQARGKAAAVYASCAPGTPVELAGPGPARPGEEGPSVEIGGTLRLSTSPALPADTEVHWSAARGGGPGGLRVTPSATAGLATVEGLRAGVVTVSLDIVHEGFAATASVPVRVLPPTVPFGTSIASDGSLDPGREAAGQPAERFDPRLLVEVSDARAVFADADARRMQRGVGRRLRALLDALDGTPGRLTVLSAYVPVAPGAAPTLASQGRELLLRHPGPSLGRLAALAHGAGFSRVAVVGGAVEVLHRAEDLIAVGGAALVEEGDRVDLRVLPDPADVSATTRLSWASGPLAPTRGQADVTTTSLPSVQLVGRRAGWVWVQATLREAGADGPYAMRVRLSSSVPPNSTVTRDQYDLIMNVVRALHPLGVEVLTRDIRPAVVELAGNSSVDPEYTYPKFRQHRPVPRSRKDADDGQRLLQPDVQAHRLGRPQGPGAGG
ncbi:LamG-like jellyroll fold domain-containing protein [Streptomyces sp. NPDC059897]|uniref:LamG-like jellyroll fold domain-containing protein n=1 Tax=Streptomyces sp. NPDC059897 TaxID=3346994 RepID=UPI003654DEAA